MKMVNAEFVHEDHWNTNAFLSELDLMMRMAIALTFWICVYQFISIESSQVSTYSGAIHGRYLPNRWHYTRYFMLQYWSIQNDATVKDKSFYSNS